MSTHADVVVVGVGGVGSAALWRLAAAGARVVGVDRFTPGHAYGSSHGHTRVYRKAYFEHPDYVPLAHHAEALWAELESATGRTLRRRTGVLQLGPADGIVVPGVLSSARRFGLTVEDLAPAEVRARFAGFHAPRTCARSSSPAAASSTSKSACAPRPPSPATSAPPSSPGAASPA
jgi:sarcosine oxidase